MPDAGHSRAEIIKPEGGRDGHRVAPEHEVPGGAGFLGPPGAAKMKRKRAPSSIKVGRAAREKLRESDIDRDFSV
jgi:hypothetical protein